jgi:hypothetical protein
LRLRRRRFRGIVRHSPMVVTAPLTHQIWADGQGSCRGANGPRLFARVDPWLPRSTWE